MRDTSTLRLVRSVRSYVAIAEAEINSIEVRPRRPDWYTFDVVGLSTLSKAFALAKACLKLLAAGLPDEAFGLSRSLVECAINLRYLTEEPPKQDRRTKDFVKYSLADKKFWYYQALEQFRGRTREAEILAYGRLHGLNPDARSAHRHWSGMSGFVWEVSMRDHPLDGSTVQPNHKRIAYASSYYQTSVLVHCSVPAIDNYHCEEFCVFRVSELRRLRDHYNQTLVSILVYLH